MTAFLKLDRCSECHRDLPWEWVPPLLLAGRPLAGTGVWRSALFERRCADCRLVLEAARQNDQRDALRRDRLLRALGGPRPYREFTFERYEQTPGNRAGLPAADRFDAITDNLYLWGPSGLGKTHLAWSIGRRQIERGGRALLTTVAQLIRQMRMRPPEEEQQVLQNAIAVDVLALDELGGGNDTPYARQVLQEILDGRAASDRAGLVVTSRFSPAGLVHRMGDDAIASRLATACCVVGMTGPNWRFRMNAARPVGVASGGYKTVPNAKSQHE